jgi:hypothetical protein
VKGESEFLFPSRGKSGLYMVVPSPAARGFSLATYI